MTDSELLSRVIGIIDPGTKVMHSLHRGGRLLLALPVQKVSAAFALRLYQPQRLVARLMIAVVRGLGHVGWQSRILPAIRIQGDAALLDPPLTHIEPETCGILLGSPEHQVRRAIVSYRRAGQWEVAKISFGRAGAEVLKAEAQVLQELHGTAHGIPCLLGLHQNHEIAVLRMPYLTGAAIPLGESKEAMQLLEQWIEDDAKQPLPEFSEWAAIQSGMPVGGSASLVLAQLSKHHLTPVICHGDFARWNLLKQADSSLIVLDWEWGHSAGMPGIDLVHYFLQDARLVRRMSAKAAIESTILDLNRPECRSYLDQTGWSGNPLLPIIACLAYKQGAGHQDNKEILKEILDFGFLMKQGLGPFHLK